MQDQTEESSLSEVWDCILVFGESQIAKKCEAFLRYGSERMFQSEKMRSIFEIWL